MDKISTYFLLFMLSFSLKLSAMEEQPKFGFRPVGQLEDDGLYPDGKKTTKKKIKLDAKPTASSVGRIMVVERFATFEDDFSKSLPLDMTTARSALSEIIKVNHTNPVEKAKLSFDTGGLIILGEILSDKNLETSMLRHLSMSITNTTLEATGKSALGIREAFFLTSLGINLTKIDRYDASHFLNSYALALQALNLKELRIEGHMTFPLFLSYCALVQQDKVGELIIAPVFEMNWPNVDGLVIESDKTHISIKKAVLKRKSRSTSGSNKAVTLINEKVR